MEKKSIAPLAPNAFLRTPTLEAATHAIEVLEEASKTNGVKIAAILANVERDGMYKEGGYKSTRAYAKEALGYKDTYITNLLNIGLKLLDADGVPQLPGGEKWSAGQLESCIPVGIETAKRMAENGVITPDMTAKEVREAVNAHKDDPEYQSTDADKPAKATVLRQYDGTVFKGDGTIAFGFTNDTLDTVENSIAFYGDESTEVQPLRMATKTPDGKHVVLMRYPSGRMYSYEYEPHAKVAKADKAAELARAKMRAAGYSDEEISNILALMGAANGK